MNNLLKAFLIILSGFMITSCASKKTLESTQLELQDMTSQLNTAKLRLDKCEDSVNKKDNMIEKQQAKFDLLNKELMLKNEQMKDMRVQIADIKKVRDQQTSQVGDLTILSQSASNNMGETIRQLEQKDKYINLIQAARTKTDSINLALAINLKSVLKNGIADEDVDIKVDKTVVFINLSDKMLYQSGSAILTQRSNEVLEKIAQIVKTRPDVEVMVEGYTDSMPIKTDCIQDNWDLSVKRSTAVIRVLQEKYGVDPNKLIAAGRGQYNTLADNSTSEGRSINRRTRIIILPKIDQFYDLLNPANNPAEIK